MKIPSTPEIMSFIYSIGPLRKAAYRAQWLRYAVSSWGPVRPPQDVNVETTSFCNRSCVYCPNNTIGRPEARMDEKLYYKIIDSLSLWGFSGRHSPHLYGEPLTDDRLALFMAYARKKLPRANIIIYTNGDYLSVEKYLALMEAGVDSFRISLHSPAMPKVLSDTLAHIKKERPELYKVEIYDVHGMNLRKLPYTLNNRGGLVDIERARRPYCREVNFLNIDHKGNVVLCCNDYLSSVTFGNAGEKDLRAIWHDPSYVKARRLVSRGIWAFDICRKCNM